MNVISAQDPYTYYKEQRKQSGIQWQGKLNAWCIYDYAIGKEALANIDFSSNYTPILKKNTFPHSLHKKIEPLLEFLQQLALYSDPPQHTAQRKELTSRFTKNIITQLTQPIDAIIHNVCRKQNREFDFVEKISNTVPAQIAAQLLNRPQSDASLFFKWTEQISAFINAPLKSDIECTAALEAVSEIKNYFGENYAISSMIMAASIDTMTIFLTNIVYLLLSNPNQMQLLKNKPELMDTAIAEILRIEPPAHVTARIATTKQLFHHKNIKKGDLIIIFLAALNRDPNYFSNPDDFIISRKKIKIFSFSHGAHTCVGQLVAQITAKKLIEHIINDWPTLSLTKQPIVWEMGSIFRKIKSLPLIINE